MNAEHLEQFPKKSSEGEARFVHGIQLGSTSAHKLEALQEACRRVGITTQITSFASPSEINAQPFGSEEIFRGAMNRARNARKNNLRAAALGVESGIISIGEKFVDRAIVVLLVPDGKSFVGASKDFELPRDAVFRAQTMGFAHTTIGDVIAESIGGSSTDTHTTLSGGKISRKALIADAIVDILTQALA